MAINPIATTGIGAEKSGQFTDTSCGTLKVVLLFRRRFGWDKKKSISITGQKCPNTNKLTGCSDGARVQEEGGLGGVIVVGNDGSHGSGNVWLGARCLGG